MNTRQIEKPECPCLQGLASEMRKLNEAMERLLERDNLLTQMADQLAHAEGRSDPLGDIGLAEVAPVDQYG